MVSKKRKRGARSGALEISPAIVMKNSRSRVFKYALQPPTSGEEALREQMFENNRYRNRLVELDNERRVAERALYRQDSDVRVAEEMMNAAKGVLAGIKKRMDEDKTARGSRAALPELRAEYEQQENEVHRCRKLMWAAQAAFRETEIWKAEKPKIDSERRLFMDKSGHAVFGALLKDARKKASREDGVYWGTTALADRSAAAASDTTYLDDDVRYARYDGSGAVAASIQYGEGKPGMTTEQVFSPDAFARNRTALIMLEPHRRAAGGSRRSSERRYGTLRMRVGGYRNPNSFVYAEWPILLHRPLPEGKISHIRVQRRRVGARWIWEALFTVKISERAPLCGQGAVAVHFGWRRVERDGKKRVRVATWMDADGVCHRVNDDTVVTDAEGKPTGVLTHVLGEGELMVPECLGDERVTADKIVQYRDKSFHAIKKAVLAWRKKWLDAASGQDFIEEWQRQWCAAHPGRDLPKWLVAPFRAMHAWSNQGRLATLFSFWLEHRVPGDEEIVGESFMSTDADRDARRRARDERLGIRRRHPGQYVRTLSKQEPDNVRRARALADVIEDEEGNWIEPKRMTLHAWLYRDRHLWQYETGLREHAEQYRRNTYRVFAARLADRYGTIITDDVEFGVGVRHNKSKPERDDLEASSVVKLVDEQRKAAGCYGARETVRNAISAREGGSVIVSAVGISCTCPRCGASDPANVADGTFVCSNCRLQRDDDVIALLNMLARAGYGDEVAKIIARGEESIGRLSALVAAED